MVIHLLHLCCSTYDDWFLERKKKTSGIKDRKELIWSRNGNLYRRPTLMQDGNELWDVCSICWLLLLMHFIRRGTCSLDETDSCAGGEATPLVGPGHIDLPHWLFSGFFLIARVQLCNNRSDLLSKEVLEQLIKMWLPAMWACYILFFFMYLYGIRQRKDTLTLWCVF